MNIHVEKCEKTRLVIEIGLEMNEMRNLRKKNNCFSICGNTLGFRHFAKAEEVLSSLVGFVYENENVPRSKKKQF